MAGTMVPIKPIDFSMKIESNFVHRANDRDSWERDWAMTHRMVAIKPSTALCMKFIVLKQL